MRIIYCLIFAPPLCITHYLLSHSMVSVVTIATAICLYPNIVLFKKNENHYKAETENDPVVKLL